MSEQSIVLEFIGGPLDGHSQVFSPPATDLAEMVALPVNRNVFRMLDGQASGPAAPARTVAFYRLDGCGEDWRYCFVGSCSAAELDLEHWQA